MKTLFIFFALVAAALPMTVFAADRLLDLPGATPGEKMKNLFKVANPMPLSALPMVDGVDGPADDWLTRHLLSNRFLSCAVASGKDVNSMGTIPILYVRNEILKHGVSAKPGAGPLYPGTPGTPDVVGPVYYVMWGYTDRPARFNFSNMADLLRDTGYALTQTPQFVVKELNNSSRYEKATAWQILTFRKKGEYIVIKNSTKSLRFPYRVRTNYIYCW